MPLKCILFFKRAVKECLDRHLPLHYYWVKEILVKLSLCVGNTGWEKKKALVLKYVWKKWYAVWVLLISPEEGGGGFTYRGNKLELDWWMQMWGNSYRLYFNYQYSAWHVICITNSHTNTLTKMMYSVHLVLVSACLEFNNKNAYKIYDGVLKPHQVLRCCFLGQLIYILYLESNHILLPLQPFLFKPLSSFPCNTSVGC